MEQTQTSPECPKDQTKFDWHRYGTWGAIGILAIYLLTEHTAHVFVALPYLVLLSCPLMHIFMHHGHGGHQHHHEEKDTK